MAHALNNTPQRAINVDHQMTIPREAAKAAPPVAVGIADRLLNIPIEKWVAAATLVYVLLQICCLIYDRVVKPKRAGRRA